MQHHHYNCIITEVTSAELTAAENDLIHSAKTAMKGAYAPYSDFKVGAAILLANGKVITASNQENAAYPSGLCAERIAIFAAGSQYPGEKIDSIAITTEKGDHDPAAPCGACRQSMIEYEVRQAQSIRLFMVSPAGRIWVSESVENLLPMVFKFVR